MPLAAAGRAGETGAAAANFMLAESLALNLDASLGVHARAHFFSWTQGLLQSLIRHELLICARRSDRPPALRADGFSMSAPDPAMLSEAFVHDAWVPAALLEAWEEKRYQPVVFDLANLTSSGGAFTRELERLGATRLLVHGVHDADGRALALFIFACRPEALGSRQTYLARLLAPALYAAWVRTQLRYTPRTPEQVPGHRVLTVRECESLKWIYLGKSNFEVGAILEISPLTVKNHVQKILRKLNVVNRTQAVGKALELCILNP